MALISCTQCGANISDKAITCPKCGSSDPFKPIPTLRKCPECSTEISCDSNFCSNCGYPNPFNEQNILPKGTEYGTERCNKNHQDSRFKEENTLPENAESNHKNFQDSFTPSTTIKETGQAGAGVAVGLIVALIGLFVMFGITAEKTSGTAMLIIVVGFPILFGILGHVGIFGKNKNVKGAIEMDFKTYKEILKEVPESISGEYGFGGFITSSDSHFILILIPLWQKTTRVYIIFTHKGIIVAIVQTYYFFIRRSNIRFISYEEIARISFKKSRRKNIEALVLQFQSMEKMELGMNNSFAERIAQYELYLKSTAKDVIIETIEKF